MDRNSPSPAPEMVGTTQSPGFTGMTWEHSLHARHPAKQKHALDHLSLPQSKAVSLPPF
jgi:hypothetical protein